MLSYQLVKIDSKFPIEKVLEFCSHSSEDTLPGAVNFDIKDWENKPYTLLWQIYIKKRYDNFNSSYIGLLSDKKLVAGAGYYPLDIDHNVVNLSSRKYTIPSYRNKLYYGNYVLPELLNQTSPIYKVGLFSFNNYNLWLKKALLRINNNKAVVFGKQTPESYKGWLELKQPLLLNNTEQYCCYKLFDLNYEDQFLENIKKIQIPNLLTN